MRHTILQNFGKASTPQKEFAFTLQVKLALTGLRKVKTKASIWCSIKIMSVDLKHETFVGQIKVRKYRFLNFSFIA